MHYITQESCMQKFSSSVKSDQEKLRIELHVWGCYYSFHLCIHIDCIVCCRPGRIECYKLCSISSRSLNRSIKKEGGGEVNVLEGGMCTENAIFPVSFQETGGMDYFMSVQ